MGSLALEELRLRQPCPTCGAKPGTWCYKIKGEGFAQAMHKKRGAETWGIWLLGFYEGLAHQKKLETRKKGKK